MTAEKVIIIIPTYNEADGIAETIRQVFASTDNNSEYDINVLVFDSASTDDTASIVEDLQAKYPKLILRSEARKTGLGSAYRQAMNYALGELNADIVIEFDADLSHQPKYLNAMLSAIKSCDVVIGSRYIKGGSIPGDWGRYRRRLSILGNYIARFFLTAKYKDFTSGFKATRCDMLQKSLPSSFISNAYAYKIELLWRLHKNKAKIIEYPIDFINREKGYSKLPGNSIVDTLRVLLSLRLSGLQSYIRMCIVGLIGLVVQLIVYNIARGYLGPFYASQVAVVLAISNNYFLNNIFTFKRPRSWVFYDKARALGIFIAYSALMILCQSYWLLLIIKQIGTGIGGHNQNGMSKIRLASIGIRECPMIHYLQ
jgi:dolichol-phosphate mannosyltransferase